MVISAIEAELIVKVEVKPQKGHVVSVADTQHLATFDKVPAGAGRMCRTTSAVSLALPRMLGRMQKSESPHFIGEGVPTEMPDKVPYHFEHHSSDHSCILALSLTPGTPGRPHKRSVKVSAVRFTL